MKIDVVFYRSYGHVYQLAAADAVIFGTPTRYGNVCAQLQNFMDATGQLWVAGA